MAPTVALPAVVPSTGPTRRSEGNLGRRRIGIGGISVAARLQSPLLAATSRPARGMPLCKNAAGPERRETRRLLRPVFLVLAGITLRGAYAVWRYGWRDLYAGPWRLYERPFVTAAPPTCCS
jgi:hypothetical protein